MNTTKTNKTRTQKTRTQEERIAGLEAGMSEIVGLLRSLATPTPAPAKGKAAKAPKTDAKREAHRARVQGIAARKAEWATHTLAHAVKLAAAEIVANRKAKAQNAKIFENSPTSLRVWLSSETNQALRSVRKREGVAYADCEEMLEKAVAKK